MRDRGHPAEPGASLREFRVRRVFNGKSGIFGTDYVPLHAADIAEAIRMVQGHLAVADEAHLELREVSEWRPLESSGA